jgi:hypothetical protein
MNMQIRTEFIVRSAPQRGQLISSAATYIKNDTFINLLQNVDINDANVKNSSKTTSIYWITAQLAAFNGDAALCKQVAAWLSAQ